LAGGRDLRGTLPAHTPQRGSTRTTRKRAAQITGGGFSVERRSECTEAASN